MKKFGEEFLENNHIETKTAVLLRILINYAQVFSVIFAIEIDWPNLMDDALGVTGKVSALSDQLFVIDCFFLLGKKAFGADIIFMKALFTAVTPFIYIFFGVIFWVVYFKIKRRPIRGNKTLSERIIMTMVIICFDQQPQVIQSGFSLLDCVNLYRSDTRVAFLQDAYDIKCWQGEHLAWMAILALPSLMIWILVLPGFVVRVLRKNRTRLNDEDIVKKYAFVYNGYKDKFFYWEVVIMFRKILFIMNNVFSNTVELQIYFALMLLFISYILQKFTEPYSMDSLNELERVSLFSLGTFIIIGLYFQTSAAGSAVDFLAILIGVGGNVYFIIYFAKLFFALQIEKLKQNEKFMKYFNYFQKKLCCCFYHEKVQHALHKAKSNFHKLSSGFRLSRLNRSSVSSSFSSPKSKHQFAQDSILSPSLSSPKKGDFSSSSKMPIFQLDPRALELSGLSPIEEPQSRLAMDDNDIDRSPQHALSSREDIPSQEASPYSAKSFDKSFYKSVLVSPGRSVAFALNGSNSESTILKDTVITKGTIFTRGTTLFQRVSNPEESSPSPVLRGLVGNPSSARGGQVTSERGHYEEVQENEDKPEEVEKKEEDGSYSARMMTPRGENSTHRSATAKKSIFASQGLRKKSEDVSKPKSDSFPSPPLRARDKKSEDNTSEKKRKKKISWDIRDFENEN